MPVTCHSLTSRYSPIASAARYDRLRPVFLASLSKRFLTAVSTRTVKVVEAMADSKIFVLDCVHYYNTRALDVKAQLANTMKTPDQVGVPSCAPLPPSLPPSGAARCGRPCWSRRAAARRRTRPRADGGRGAAPRAASA